jgi:hypothetical protein
MKCSYELTVYRLRLGLGADVLFYSIVDSILQQPVTQNIKEQLSVSTCNDVVLQADNVYASLLLHNSIMCIYEHDMIMVHYLNKCYEITRGRIHV